MLDLLIEKINRKHRALRYSECCANKIRNLKQRKAKRLAAASIVTVTVCAGAVGLHRTLAKAEAKGNLANHELWAGEVIYTIEGGKERDDLVTIAFDNGNLYDAYADDLCPGDKVVCVVNTKGTPEKRDDIIRDVLYVREV